MILAAMSAFRVCCCQFSVLSCVCVWCARCFVGCSLFSFDGKHSTPPPRALAPTPCPGFGRHFSSLRRGHSIVDMGG